MTALLVITGLLLLVSGGLKVRSGMRARLGVHVLSLIELLAGLVWLMGALTGFGAAAESAWLVPFGVALVVASSSLFWVRLSAYRKKRAESEGRRLENFVKYLSRSVESPGGTD